MYINLNTQRHTKCKHSEHTPKKVVLNCDFDTQRRVQRLRFGHFYHGLVLILDGRVRLAVRDHVKRPGRQCEDIIRRCSDEHTAHLLSH